MANMKEQYLNALTKRACEIMGKTELTQQDIDFLMLFKSELRRAEYIPKIKRIINGAKDVVSFMQQFNNSDISEVKTITENTDNGNEL